MKSLLFNFTLTYPERDTALGKPRHTLYYGEYPRFSERILLMRQTPLSRTYQVTTALVTPQRSSRGSLQFN